MNSTSGTTAAIDWARMPKWITTQEAAEAPGFHPEYIRELARASKIGASKKGRDWWIDRDVLKSYLETVEALGPKKFDPRGLPETADA